MILQPSYIPWRGYFDQIRRADVFVFYDDVQYDKHGWRNRNIIKTPNGPLWLTIPVHSRGVVTDARPINDVAIDWSTRWPVRLLKSLQQYYGRAPFFAMFADMMDHLYAGRDEILAEFTIRSTIALARCLGIADTRFVRSSELASRGRRTDRIVSICREVGCDRYLSGPSARGYLEPAKFLDAGIELEYMSYRYPEYPQLYPPYDPYVSILDLLFMEGPEAASFIP